MKTRLFSILMLILLCTPASGINAAVMIETEITSGTISNIDSSSITLDNTMRFFSKLESTGKLPFQVNDIVTIRYIKQSDGRLVYVEAAKGRNSLPSAENKLITRGKELM